MDFYVLNRISQMENDKQLSVLYLAYQNQESRDIINLFQNYQHHFDVGCLSHFAIGYFRTHAAVSKNINLCLVEQLSKANKYDVIITSSLMHKGLQFLFNTYSFKYVLTIYDEGLIPHGYQKINDTLFKKVQTVEQKKEQIKHEQIKKQQKLNEEKQQKTEENSELFKEFTEEYEIKPVKYGKYGINYLYDVVPGKLSIIMIVSQRNNNFAEVIRDLKSQNVESVEYIIIDNAAGFRNNIKPNIRYGEKMPLDFCEYHAKQISSGEYIIVLNETSKTFKIADQIAKGKYETR